MACAIFPANRTTGGIRARIRLGNLRVALIFVHMVCSGTVPRKRRSRRSDANTRGETDNTAAGDEAILECTKGNYCCDTNRPEKGCCDTTQDRFQLPDGKARSSGDGGAQASASASSPKKSSTMVPVPAGSKPTPDPKILEVDPTSIVAAQSTSGIGPQLVTSLGGTSPIPKATPALANTPTHQQATQRGDVIGTIIGGAVGVPVGIILTVAVLFLFRRHRKKAAQEKLTPLARSDPFEPDQLDYMYKETAQLSSVRPSTEWPSSGPGELHGSSLRRSNIIGTSENPAELPDLPRMGHP